jgi:hypothetical protein
VKASQLRWSVKQLRYDRKGLQTAADMRKTLQGRRKSGPFAILWPEFAVIQATLRRAG